MRRVKCHPLGTQGMMMGVPRACRGTSPIRKRPPSSVSPRTLGLGSAFSVRYPCTEPRAPPGPPQSYMGAAGLQWGVPPCGRGTFALESSLSAGAYMAGVLR